MMRAVGNLTTVTAERSRATNRLLERGAVLALACLAFSSVCLSEEGGAATTMASRTALALTAEYDGVRAELTLTLLNKGQAAVKVDEGLIFGMDISAVAQDGTAVVWEEMPASPRHGSLSPQVAELLPGKAIRRVVALRDGFDYFEAARGAVSKGNISVNVTTARYGRRRMPAQSFPPRRISIAFDARSRLLRDGFTYCTGMTPESLGLELGPVGPVVVDLEKTASDTRAGPAKTPDHRPD